MVQRLILIAIFLVMTFGASSARALTVSAKPVWNGWVRAGMPTEVAIRVISDRGGPLTLKLSDGAISYNQKTSLEPKVEFVWRVPLSPPSGAPLQLFAQLDEEPGIEQEIIFRRHLAPSPLVAVLAGQPLPLDGVDATTIYLAHDSLPFHNASFAAIDLILINQDSLQGMARQQLIALRQHAAQCGRILIIGFAPAAIAGFANLAGCGGRFLIASSTLVDIDTRVAGLLEARVPQLPSPGSLHGLLDKNGMAHKIQPLILFFTIYLLVLLIAVRSHHAALYAVSASIAATLVGLITWTLSPEHIERVVWAEMENRANVARFNLIQRVLGSGRRTTIDIPVNTGALQALQPMKLAFTLGQNGGDAASVSFDTQLFSQHEFVASGVTTMQVPLILEYSDNIPRLTNASADISPPAVLAWNDLKYSIPALTPGQGWQPSSGSEAWGSNHAEQLFRQRAMLETTALFFEYPPSGQQPADTALTYLMVRP